MNKTRIILLYIFFSLFVSCRTTKKVTEKYVSIKNDSVSRTLQLKTDNVLTIANICDTITFKAKDFSNSVNVGLSKTKVSIKDNILTVETKSDSIVYVDRIVKEVQYIDRIEIITTNKTPSWAWLLILLLALGNVIGFRLWKLFI